MRLPPVAVGSYDSATRSVPLESISMPTGTKKDDHIVESGRPSPPLPKLPLPATATMKFVERDKLNKAWFIAATIQTTPRASSKARPYGRHIATDVARVGTVGSGAPQLPDPAKVLIIPSVVTTRTRWLPSSLRRTRPSGSVIAATAPPSRASIARPPSPEKPDTPVPANVYITADGSAIALTILPS